MKNSTMKLKFQLKFCFHFHAKFWGGIEKTSAIVGRSSSNFVNKHRKKLKTPSKVQAMSVINNSWWFFTSLRRPSDDVSIFFRIVCWLFLDPKIIFLLPKFFVCDFIWVFRWANEIKPLGTFGDDVVCAGACRRLYVNDNVWLMFYLCAI